MKDGRKQVSSKATSRGIFEDFRASPRVPFSCENVNNKKESLGNSLVSIELLESGLQKTFDSYVIRYSNDTHITPN